jgi:hypothetical protein
VTANCGWWLSNERAYSRPEDDSEATKAGAYLERYLAPDGSLPSFLHTYWLAAALWIRLKWKGAFWPTGPEEGRPELPEQAKRTLDYLATRLHGEMPAGALGWMLTTLAPLGVPPEHPAIVKALALLSEQQRPDGGWTSEDGSERDAWVTAQALLALNPWKAGVPGGLSEPKDAP